jgi:ATP-binding cassette subfamily F protein 3
VQSRVKMLEKLERIPPPPSEDAVMHFKFPEPERSGKVVMDISEFSKSYEREEGGAVDVFVRARPLTVSRGDKIALIGKNGAGKSTLARILLGTEPFHGDRKVGHNVEVTFFAQHQAEALDPGKTILEEMESEAAAQNETEIRSLLGAFLFSDNEVYKKVSVLSGGEKSRVALAKTLLSPKNFMILDEPTNHLDIQSRKVLIEALRQYKGTFVVVSHDRHFLDEVANKIWYAEGSKVVTYPGTYSEFRYHQSQKLKSDSDDGGEEVVKERIGASGLESESPQDLSTRELDKKKEAEKRNRLYRELKDRGIENMDNWSELTSRQLSKALSELEKKIHELEDKKTELETFLADPDNFMDQSRSREASREFSLIGEKLGRLYDRWEAVTSHLEKMPAD